MSSEEEYLDQLLAQALNPKKEKKEPEKKNEPVDAAVPADAAAETAAENVTESGTESVMSSGIEETASDTVIEADTAEAVSGDFDVPEPADVPEFDLNSQGAKDFNLDGISADELASEIEAFEEDADDSVLPTGESADYDVPGDMPEIAEAIVDAENIGADVAGMSETEEPASEGSPMPDMAESVSNMDAAPEDVGLPETPDMPEAEGQDESIDIPKNAEPDMEAEMPEDHADEEDTDGLADVETSGEEAVNEENSIEENSIEENSADGTDEEKIDDAVNKILDEIPEDVQKEIGDIAPEDGLADNDVPETEAADGISDIDDINAVDDLLSAVEEAGSIDDEAISDFSETVDAEGEADDLMSLLKGDGAGDDIQSDLSELADMDPDDLEARIAAAEADVPGESLPSTEGDADILDMLSDMDVLDGDLGDIKDVLEKSDNNEAVNADLLKEPDVGLDSFDDDSDEEESEGGKKSKKKKKEKKKKEKGDSFFAKLFGKKKKDKDAEAEVDGEAPSEPAEADTAESSDMDLLDDMSDISGDLSEESASEGDAAEDDGTDDASGKKKKKKEKGDKKKGLIAALLEAVFYEEDEEGSPEESATKLSDENKQILNELDAEGEEKGKKKKKKKEKKPKEKKPKKPKEKKPKKEKPAGEEEKGPKIPKKYIVRSAAFAVSVLAAAIVLAVLLPKANVMKSARAAYYDQDYKEAFYSMYGKKLNESDQLIYDRSKTIILMDRKYESYGQYKAMGMNDKALDALFQGLKRYEGLKTEAETLGVISDIDATRNNILLALQNDYGVSEAQAMEIIGYSKTDYTGAVNAILMGEPYVKMQDAVNAMYGLGGSSSVEPETPEEGNAADPGLPDMLPEEEQYILENGTDPNVSNDAEAPEENAAEENTEENTNEDNAPENNQPEDNTAEQNSTNIIVDTDDNVQVQIDSEQF